MQHVRVIDRAQAALCEIDGRAGDGRRSLLRFLLLSCSCSEPSVSGCAGVTGSCTEAGTDGCAGVRSSRMIFTPKMTAAVSSTSVSASRK